MRVKPRPSQGKGRRRSAARERIGSGDAVGCIDMRQVLLYLVLVLLEVEDKTAGGSRDGARTGGAAGR